MNANAPPYDRVAPGYERNREAGQVIQGPPKTTTANCIAAKKRLMPQETSRKSFITPTKKG